MPFWDAVWEKLKAWGSWAVRQFLVPGVALLIVIGAVILVSMGAKELQIGGLLARLLGKKPDGSAVDVANSVDPDRVDKDGKLIQPGVPDSKGQTQAVVVPIENADGLFSNPDTVKFTPPGENKPREILLPDGVRAKDVDKVVVVQPEKFVVVVKDSSGIDAGTIDDLLSKYGD